MILANPYITGAPIDSISCHLRAVGYKFASARWLRYLPDARSSPDARRAWSARDAEIAGVPNAGTRGRPETVPTVRATSGSPLNSTWAGPAACVSLPTVFILSNTIHSLYNAMFIHVLVVLKLHGVNKGNHIKNPEMWPPLYKGQRVVPQWWPPLYKGQRVVPQWWPL